MKTVLVSLVSDQTIPNILAIKHFVPDQLLFLTTEKMKKKKKTDAILTTLEMLGLNFQNKYGEETVKEDSLLDCHRKIDRLVLGDENSKFIVNLTCGTKIMAIAAYEYFKDFDSRMIYIPIPRNEFIMPFPKRAPSKPIFLDTRLSVTQYLSACGLRVLNNKKLDKYIEDAESKKEVTEWIVKNYKKIKNLLVWFGSNLRKHRDDKSVNFSAKFSGASKEENVLLQRFDFTLKDDYVAKKLNHSEIGYLTGGWLEEYCFNKVSELLRHGIDDVVIGIKIMNARERDNEFDVMFTRGNTLYSVECKSLDQHDDKSTDILYKIGALQKEFGLRIESFLVTTSPYIIKNEAVKFSIKARAEQFKTTIVSPHRVGNFKEILIDNLKIDKKQSRNYD